MISTVSSSAPLEAVTTTVPGATNVSWPPSVMVAIVGSETDQVTARPARASPSTITVAPRVAGVPSADRQAVDGGGVDRDRVGFDLSGTWLDARDLTADAPLEGRAALRGTAGVRLDVGDLGPRLTTRGSLVGPRPFGDQQAPAYALLDARVAQPLGTDQLSLYAGGENLLNAGDPVFLPTPPRLLYAGIDARL